MFWIGKQVSLNYYNKENTQSEYYPAVLGNNVSPRCHVPPPGSNALRTSYPEALGTQGDHFSSLFRSFKNSKISHFPVMTSCWLSFHPTPSFLAWGAFVVFMLIICKRARSELEDGRVGACKGSEGRWGQARPWQYSELVKLNWSPGSGCQIQISLCYSNIGLDQAWRPSVSHWHMEKSLPALGWPWEFYEVAVKPGPGVPHILDSASGVLVNSIWWVNGGMEGILVDSKAKDILEAISSTEVLAPL